MKEFNKDYKPKDLPAASEEKIDAFIDDIMLRFGGLDLDK